MLVKGEAMHEPQVNFVGIGAFRSGTTWTAQCLSEHPQVFIAEKKELNYFCSRYTFRNFPVSGTYYQSTHFDGGEEWLRSCFADYLLNQMRGEFSPTYFDDPESPRLLYEHNPQMKLIVNFRNPIDAMYSIYRRASNFIDVGKTFEEYLKKYPESIEYSHYHYHTQRFLQLFPRNQVHFIVFDEIFKNPAAVFKNLCIFLRIDTGFLPPSLQQKVNPSFEFRSKGIFHAGKRFIELLNSSPIGRTVKGVLNLFGVGKAIHRAHYQYNRRITSKVPISPALRAQLIDYFREENHELGDLIGYDFSSWNVIKK